MVEKTASDLANLSWLRPNRAVLDFINFELLQTAKTKPSSLPTWDPDLLNLITRPVLGYLPK